MGKIVKLEVCGYLLIIMINIWASWVGLVVKNLLANAREIKDADLIPGLRRSPEEGNN